MGLPKRVRFLLHQMWNLVQFKLIKNKANDSYINVKACECLTNLTQVLSPPKLLLNLLTVINPRLQLRHHPQRF